MHFLIEANLDKSAKSVEISVPGDDPLIAEILAEAIKSAVLPILAQTVLKYGVAFLAFRNGKVRLNNDKRASHYCLQEGSTLHLMASRVLPDYENLYEFEPEERRYLVSISQQILAEEVSWDDGVWSLYEVVRDSAVRSFGATCLGGVYAIIDALDEGQEFDAKLYSPDMVKRKQASRDEMLRVCPPRTRKMAQEIVDTLFVSGADG